MVVPLDGAATEADRTNEPRDAAPLKVVQIVTTLAHGGAQETVLALNGAPASNSRPVSVAILAGADSSAEGSLWNHAEAGQLDVVPVPNLVRRLSPILDVRALLWLIRYLRRQSPDVVHTHSSKAGVLGRLAALVAGVPVVHTIHGWGSTPVAGWLARSAVLMVERLLARVTERLVVVGESDREQGLRWRVGSAHQYVLIRSGVAVGDDPLLRQLSRRRWRDELGVADRFVVGMVARFSPQKDHRTLINALAKVTSRNSEADIAVLLVGDGPTRPDIESLVAELGLEHQVRFLGHRTDGAQLVHAFDVSVTASRWEGLPRTVLEAAAAGVPVIASDVGSVSDFVDHGRTGLLVQPGRPDQLADAIEQVRTDRRLAERLADLALIRVDEFSVDDMRDATVDLWFDVATGRSGR